MGQQQWMTMTTVCDMLGISPESVRKVVQSALVREQTWVKKEAYPAPDSTLHWFIDINHDLYHYHEKRWRKLAAKRKQDVSMTENMANNAQTGEVTQVWQELCHWLAGQGLLVFYNAIAPTPQWQWSWNGYSGAGYATVNAAVVAALQYSLLFAMPFLPTTYPEVAKERDS